jgi:gluconate 2-dehydrogenase gamma chain
LTVTELMSRRRFVQSAGTAAGASLLRISATSLAAIAQAACGARDKGAAFATLDATEAEDFAAIAARLIPTTDTPGATEAGVIHFYDRAWGDELGWALEDVRSLLQTLNESVGARFATLSADAQDETLRAHEDDGRFQLLWLVTMFGFFAMEKHGGNRNHVSWDLVGFEGHRGAWAPPFGYYDAHYVKENDDGE